MAENPVITCPECDRKFRGKVEMEGKKIRCPLCSEPFRVTADLMSFSAPAGRKEVKSKPEPAAKSEPPPPPPPPAPAPEAKDDFDEDLDADGKPYVVTHEELKPRCPSCAKEMLDEKAIVCVYCGYNTLTRVVGKTEKTMAITGKDHFIHLLPAVGSLVWAVVATMGLLYFCTELPRKVKNSWASFTDSEAMRMWAAIIGLFQIFAAGYFGIFKIIKEPKPKEQEKD